MYPQFKHMTWFGALCLDGNEEHKENLSELGAVFDTEADAA